MSLLVDTSVWSLGLRRDVDSEVPQVEALIAQLCMRHELTLLTTDKCFVQAANHCRLDVRR